MGVQLQDLVVSVFELEIPSDDAVGARVRIVPTGSYILTLRPQLVHQLGTIRRCDLWRRCVTGHTCVPPSKC